MAVERFACGDELPEGCIATALSLTSPKDACRLALVASTFRSAAESDAVWERFLPPDYYDIISRFIDGPDSLNFGSKKDLYLYLCDNPILIDGGTKSFSLEKGSGKKCYMLAARSLQIVWVDTPRHWRWISLPESRFSEVAELLDVCWFDISGKINTNMLSPDTTYGAYLVFTTKTRTCGFENQPAESSVGIAGHERYTHTFYLNPRGGRRQYRYQVVPRRLGIFTHHMARILREETEDAPKGCRPKQRSDGWMEIELGEFFVKRGQEAEVEISLTEVKGGDRKAGLIIEGIDIRPKE
ncbi:hypothetical protein EJD97_007122 [Solanum chilense]|uniref:F-box domain-containing protein n=1 Tax=Solanum chilense TaxID=4083 RepID=A0A6N2BND3_SOLCI|nr:hypothetical protein EJD97_007122 [Solanum chilense]